MLPSRFNSSDALNRKYQQEERKYIGLIKHKASTWSHRGAGDIRDLIQEGRCCLLYALSRFDESRGKTMPQFLGRILDNTYTSMLSAALAQKRCPSIWERSGSVWKRVPYPELSVEQAREELGADPQSDEKPLPGEVDSEMTPETIAMYKQRSDNAKVLLVRLQNRLTPEQRSVLGCVIRPPAGLVVTARNLSGAYHVRNVHIAAYLGITKNQVDYALYNIRKQIVQLFNEAGPDQEA